MNLTVIDLDAILDVTKINKSSLFSKLSSKSTIMFAGCDLTKSEIDNFHVFHHYFYNKDDSRLFKNCEFVDYVHSLNDAIEITQRCQNISDEEVFVLCRKLETLSEARSYHVFDLEDSFTELYDSENEVDTFVKKMVYR